MALWRLPGLALQEEGGEQEARPAQSATLGATLLGHGVSCQPPGTKQEGHGTFKLWQSLTLWISSRATREEGDDVDVCGVMVAARALSLFIVKVSKNTNEQFLDFLFTFWREP